MKFGKQLQGTMVPEWSSYYMDYKALKKEIKQLAAAEEAPSHVKVERFVEQLGSQLDGVNAFFKAEEASVMAKWRTIDLIMMDSISPEDKQEMTEWLRARLQTNAGAPGAEAPRASRNQLGLFCDVYDAAQKLRQYVAINYVGFVKGMKKFEKKTSLSVGHIFMPRLQRTTFFNSPKLAILLAEVDCSAKDLLLRLGLQAGDMQSEFRCGLCSEVMRQPVRRLPLQLRPAAAAQLTPRLSNRRSCCRARTASAGSARHRPRRWRPRRGNGPARAAAGPRLSTPRCTASRHPCARWCRGTWAPTRLAPPALSLPPLPLLPPLRKGRSRRRRSAHLRMTRRRRF